MRVSDFTILETPFISDVIPLIDRETWLLLDLDNTLFEAKQSMGHALWFDDEVEKRMKKGMTRKEALHDFYPLWIQTLEDCSVKPLENNFLPTLLAFQNQGITLMALTHRQPVIMPQTMKQISSLGFEFIKTAPSKESFSLPADYPTLYHQGILFVHDLNRKGAIFINFLLHLRQFPKKIVFMDDKKSNVEDLKNCLSQFDTQYIGVHYTAIKQAKSLSAI